jgi:hypothetical protein
MAYDEGLATRVRDAIGDRPGLAEKQMFGGLTFLVHGNDLRRWVDRGVAYAASLPPKGP